MWGNLQLEIFYLNSFNFSFPNSYNDMLLNLTFWQYWWWFWFIFFFVLYYFIALRLIRFRFFKFNPKIVTSYRAHGKWGDLIICFIPISWCLNIITNSNLLLRILEWQGETGLLTLRVRGKQWYWVYKFELKSFIDIIQTNKKLGSGKFKNLNHLNNDNVSIYLYFINKRNSYSSLKSHWSQYFLFASYNYNYNNINVVNFQKNSKFLIDTDSTYFSKNINLYSSTSCRNFFFLTMLNLVSYNFFNSEFFFNLWYLFQYDLNIKFSFFKNFFKVNIFSFYNNNSTFCMLYSDFLENFRHVKAHNQRKKTLLSIISNNETKNYPINLFFKDKGLNSFSKDNNLLYFLVIKQKRYVPKKNANFYGSELSSSKILNSRHTKVFFYQNLDLNITKMFFKSIRGYTGILNLTLNKRLLRTRRLLVLPAHFNISVITNSFDVVHSWYIPGLGIKLDCVPGRSTHHNIYIPSFGFYYGQCAEICGRYHHHMPIRICALPFEHFLVWWYNYSINVYLSFTKNRLNFNKTSIRYYTW